ncbi:hypothetical protein ABIE13_005615, partial [Ottowia thiooxydans]
LNHQQSDQLINLPATPLNCLSVISEAFDYCMIFINLATTGVFEPAS